MGKINVLSFAVANLIAAGEVVDRPASVIKELMENSIDSGADRITVEIQNGGVVFMRVSDNGGGIEKDDLPVAVRRHATSKIKDANDLDGIMTLGFRGEALAAIAAVSDLRIISRVKGAPNGACIEVSGGDIVGVSERGCSEGTSVIVENLFYNVPARRKFLKKNVTETAAVSAAVEKVALSRPDIAFQFITDGNIKMETAGDGKLQNTIYAIYGRDFAKSLIEVKYDYEGISVSGFTGRSDNVKPNRNSQSFFINGRYVKSKTATAAVEQAYCSYIPPEKFPVCVLNIDISPKAVDVNVHPAKLEVKFSNEKPVFEAIYYGIRNALESNITRPDINPEKISRMSYEEYRKAFAPAALQGDNNIVNTKPGAIYETAKNVSLPKEEKPQKAVEPDINMPKAEMRIVDNNTAPIRITPDEYIEEYKNIDVSEASQESSSLPFAEAPYNDEETVSKKAANPADIQYTIQTVQAAQTNSAENPVVSQYRIIGEVFNSYVIVEYGEKLMLIDKHAAHERIIFEKLKAGMKSTEVHSQTLMLPLEFMLTSDEVMTLSQYKPEIEKIGFTYEAEKYTVKVNSVPEVIELTVVPDIFMTLADRLGSDTGNAGLTRDIIFEKALYQASCKAAIKAGREYSDEHIKWIIEKLMELPDITFCPHGRPVAMELTKKTLDRQFGRT